MSRSDGLHWKIARDPYLGPLARKHGSQVAWEAGFFFDEDPTDASLDDVSWLCTPPPKLCARGASPVVLLATGGFFPVHVGHLAMMETARATAEAAGWEIIGGYLSPGHDAYLRLKCGPDARPASERLHQCAQALAPSDWLSVDPWEALHRRGAVNYTDVAARLQAYLRAHVHPGVVVVYVCGGDNARFASAFVEQGGCVVVGRPGAEDAWSSWRAKLTGHPRILFAEGTLAAASREIRAAAKQPLSASESASLTEQRPSLLVRLEDARVVRTLGLADRLPAFQDELLGLLRRQAHVRVQRATLSETTHPAHVISLDPLHPARFNLALSRLFALGGYQALGHVARPGEPHLAEQIARVPPGAYVLRDDDAMSGATLATIRKALPPSIQIVATELALTPAPSEDVLDARDFLLGADEGGLVLALPRAQSAREAGTADATSMGRAPYLLPYVDPLVRASLPEVHAFSRDVWDLNARFFAGTQLRVSHLPLPARAIFELVAAAASASASASDMLLEDLCRWHAQRLADLVPRSPS